MRKTLIFIALALASGLALAQQPGNPDREAARAEWRAKADARWAESDKDGDGTLDRIEVQAGHPRLAERFDKIDANAELTFDAELAYEAFDGLELAVGAQNVFDNYPIENPYSGIVGAKYGERSPFGFNGGSYYLRARFQW